MMVANWVHLREIP
jgi:hypothetical protein